MKEIAGFFLEKVWPTVTASASDAGTYFRSNAVFFSEMKARTGACSRAWFFGIVVAVGLGVLGLPASRSAGITPTAEFAVVMTLANWLLIALYGVCFGLAARMLGSQRGLLTSVNTFFYLSGWMVFLKIFEMPALGARLKGMAQSCSLDGYDLAVTTAIQHSSMAFVSDKMVLGGYLAFVYFCVIRMQRQLHDFGGVKAWLATAVGMALLSVIIMIVQEPVISQLVCSYANQP